MRAVALAFLLAVTGTPGRPAAADCPALTPSATWAERLTAVFAGRAQRPSAPEIQDLLRREQMPPLIVLPTSGPAPLEVGGALECRHRESRKRYAPSFFKSLFVDRRTPVNALASIRLVEMHGTAAIYAMQRTCRRGQLSYQVTFEVDVDGVWRLRSF
jgi:hypothetical protein